MTIGAISAVSAAIGALIPQSQNQKNSQAQRLGITQATTAGTHLQLTHHRHIHAIGKGKSVTASTSAGGSLLDVIA